MAMNITGIKAEAGLADRIRQTGTQGATNTTAANTGSSVADLQNQIALKQKEKDQASELITQNNNEIAELEKKINDLKAQIADKMATALNEGEALTDQQKTNVDNAVTQTVAKYLRGEITKAQLMETLKTTLAGSESELAGKLGELMDNSDSMVSEIEGMISQICDLASQNEELKQKILDADKAIASCQSQIAAEAAKESGCCDPIGFEKDNVTYDFIVDRDGDGEFDGPNEFMGAENGFEEVKAMDKDGNGIVEGEELNGAKMIKTDKKTGEQSFVTAQEAGVTSIDLSTYQKTGYKMANGNEHLGNFDINAQGETIKGYQTLDKVDWLKANYGNSYGKSIDSKATTKVENNTNVTKNIANAKAMTKAKATDVDVKKLDPAAESKLIDDTEESIANAISVTLATNIGAVDTVNNNYKEEKIKEENPVENNKKETTDKKDKPSTMSFMAMAYAFNAEDMKKKQIA